MRDESRRYLQAVRMQIARDLIESNVRLTVYVLAERLECTRVTALRVLRALRESGYAFREVREGRTIVYCRPEKAERNAISATLSQLVDFTLMKQWAHTLRGVGLDDELDELCRKVDMKIADSAYANLLDIDARIHVVHGPLPRIALARDRMLEILAAIFECERLEITTVKREKGRRTFRIEPYAMLLYDGIPYVVGYSAHPSHEGVRTFGCDTLVAVKRLVGERFERPEGFHPKQMLDGCFGLMGGKPERVRVRFDASEARYVMRLMWHPSQTWLELDDGRVELRMTVRGVEEVKRWILWFGSRAEVMEPEWLRKDMRATGEGIVDRYRERRPWATKAGKEARRREKMLKERG